jgi:hypothetical protein
MGPTISSTAETIPCPPPTRAPEEAAAMAAAAAEEEEEERSLDGAGLETSAEWRSSRGRDRDIREAVDASPEMGDSGGGGGGGGRDRHGHSRRRREGFGA